MSARDQAIHTRSQSTLLRGKVVLLCGGTEGVGRVSARLFAAHGAWVAIFFRADLAGARGLVDQIRSDGGRAILVPGDVATREGAWQVARYVEHEWGQIDVLLNATPLAGHSEEIVSDPWTIAHEVLPGMHQRGWGRVVTFGRPGDIVADPSTHPPTPLDATPAVPDSTGQPPAHIVSLAGGARPGEQLYQAAASVALSLCITLEPATSRMGDADHWGNLDDVGGTGTSDPSMASRANSTAGVDSGHGGDGIVADVTINYILVQER